VADRGPLPPRGVAGQGQGPGPGTGAAPGLLFNHTVHVYVSAKVISYCTIAVHQVYCAASQKVKLFQMCCRSRNEQRNPGNNLYVTGLSTRTSSSDLEKFFSKEGKVNASHPTLILPSCLISLLTCGRLCL
jgi:hypothetical protein